MGLMGRILGAGGAAAGVGEAVGNVAEIFVGNRAERDAASHEQFIAALGQYGLEFQQPASGRFDRFMNGLNRLPRPLLVSSTLGLFAFSMCAPDAFAVRMQGLALVPEPLWWLLGAIVSFYFGARELHYQRAQGSVVPTSVRALVAATEGPASEPAGSPRPAPRPAAATPEPSVPAVTVRAADPEFNAAVEEWRSLGS